MTLVNGLSNTTASDVVINQFYDVDGRSVQCFLCMVCYRPPYMISLLERIRYQRFLSVYLSHSVRVVNPVKILQP